MADNFMDPYQQIYQEAQGRATGLGANLADLYNQVRQSGLNQINQAAAPNRQKLLNEQAALGRSGSPISSYNTNMFDTGVNNTMGQFIGGLAQNQIGNQMTLSNQLENILQNARGNLQQGHQFGQTLDLENRKFKQDILENQANRELKKQISDSGLAWDRELAAAQGRQNLENQPGLMDKIQKGVTLGNSIFNLLAPTSAVAANMMGGGKTPPVDPKAAATLLA